MVAKRKGIERKPEFIRVLAEVIGESERITTQEVRVQPGLVIEWKIATALSHSSMMYYVR